MLPGVGDGLPDDLLMAEMHAVEHADGQADFPSASSQFGCGVDEFHSKKSSNIQAPGTREIPNFKFQTTRLFLESFLKFGAWCFSGCWMLKFGAFISCRRQLQK